MSHGRTFEKQMKIMRHTPNALSSLHTHNSIKVSGSSQTLSNDLDGCDLLLAFQYRLMVNIA